MVKKNAMFEKITLNQKISDSEYENILPTLQRETHQLKVPLMRVFEGWHAAGVSNIIDELIPGLDPRGITCPTIDLPTREQH